MGKYNLGTATTKIDNKMNKSSLYINTDKFIGIQEDMNNQLDNIRTSLISISSLMNNAVKNSVVSGSYADAFRGWAKKCSSQAKSVSERKKLLIEKYSSDIKKYTMDLLDSRIAELESQISSLSE